jgi:hypothetical protein
LFIHCLKVYLSYQLGDDFTEIKELNKGKTIIIVETKSVEQKVYNVQIRNRILEMIIGILHEESGNVEFAIDFLHIISTKWIALFWGPRLDGHTVLLAIQIFAKLQILLPSGSVSSFPEMAPLLARAIQPYYGIIDIYPALIFSICGIDPSLFGEDFEFEMSTMNTLLTNEHHEANKLKKGSAAILLSIYTMISNSVRTITMEISNLDPSNDERNVEDQLKHLCNIIQTTISSLSCIYRHFDVLKASVCKIDNMEKLITLILKLLSSEVDFGSTKINRAGPNLSIEAFSPKQLNVDCLKLKWTYVGAKVETGETSFSVIQKQLVNNTSNDEEIHGYLLVETKVSSWAKIEKSTSKLILTELLSFVTTVLLFFTKDSGRICS